MIQIGDVQEHTAAFLRLLDEWEKLPRFVKTNIRRITEGGKLMSTNGFLEAFHFLRQAADELSDHETQYEVEDLQTYFFGLLSLDEQEAIRNAGSGEAEP